MKKPPWKPIPDKLTVRMLITPEIAKQMLDTNSSNRPTNQGKIARFVAKMKAGLWTFTHQGIGFSKEGILIDGQHRLIALVLSGSSFEFLVTYGLEPKVFKDVDSPGMSRNSSDLFAIIRPDAQYRREICGIARAMLTGLIGRKAIDPSKVAEFADENYNSLLTLYKEFQPLPGWTRPAPLIAAFANAARKEDGWPGGHGGHDLDTIMLPAMRYGQEEWDGPKDPLKALYNRIIRTRTSVGTGLSHKEYYAFTIGALRLCLQGKTSKHAKMAETEWGSYRDRAILAKKGKRHED